jgi:hypothetical protein
MNENPYQSPESPISASPTSGLSQAHIEKVAAGQKMIIYAILLYFLAVGGQFVVGPIAALLILGTFFLGLIGIIRLASGFGYSVLRIILLIIGMIIPLIGLLILLTLNARATKELRASGYKVGLLGATKIKAV